MSEVIISVAGRSYTLACRDGDEARVTDLASDIAAKAERLTRSIGTMSEARLLLMAALMIADELHDIRQSRLADWVQPQGGAGDDPRLVALAATAEAMAERFAATS